jgi:hypothetical protein
MAENKKVEIDLSINTGKTENSLQAIKRELKELKASALDFGEGTAGFNEATKRAGELNDKLADVNGTIKALSGNTTENLTRSFTGVAQAGVGGFQAIIGAQALFGEKNKEVQETLVKLQGAMAFASGLKEFSNLGQAAKDFKVVLLSLIPTIATKTAVTATDTVVQEANVVAQEQNLLVMLATNIASAVASIRNGILTATTGTLTVSTTAFGVASAVAWSIATLGVAALIAGIVALIVYFDDIKAKFDEFGVAGKIALNIILGPLYLLYQGLEKLGEMFGFLDTEAEASAKKRVEAEEEFAKSINESTNKIAEARRKSRLLVAGEDKIQVQADIDRERAKEDFITNYIAIKAAEKIEIQKDGSAERVSIIKKDTELKIKAIDEEYRYELREIKKTQEDATKAKKEENDKASAAKVKSNQDANDKIKEANKKADEEKFNQERENRLKIAEINKEYLRGEQDRLIQERDKKLSEIKGNTLEAEMAREKIINDYAPKIFKASMKPVEELKLTIKETPLPPVVIAVDDITAGEKITAFVENYADKIIEIATFVTDTIGQISSASISNEETNLNIEEKNLQRQYETRKKYIEENITDERQRTTALNNLNKQQAASEVALEKKRVELEKRKIKAERNATLIQLALATATSIANAVKIASTSSFDPISFTINIAANIAAALLAINKARNALREADAAGAGGGGDVNTSAGGGGGGSGEQAPTSPPTFTLGGQPAIGGASNMLGNGVGGGGQAPIKVFVTETDISNVQGKVNVIQGNSLFGG